MEEIGEGVLKAPMGEEQKNIGGEATKSGEALVVNLNVTSEREMKGKFFNQFIKLQAV